MKEIIWGKEFEGLVETAGPDYEHKFIQATARLIAEALGVSWQDRHLVQCLLESALCRDLEDLLKQYLHSQLEIIGRSFNRELGLEEQIETRYATHAKMDNFISAIKLKYLEQKLEEGTLDEKV